MRPSVRRAALLVLLASVVGYAGWMTRKIRLTNKLTVPPHPEQMISVSDLRISAPVQGQNVCEFVDLWRDVQTVGSSSGGVYVGMTVDSGVYRRGTFNYLLVEDSAPLLKDALQSLGIRVDPSSPRVADVSAKFAYFFIDPEKVMSAHISNELAIRMDLDLVIKEQDRIVAKRMYTRTDVEKYSTAWVTFPRETTLNSLYNKALSNILSQIAADNELQAAIKSR